MTRIDRYILFLYIRVLVICFVSLAGLLIIVQVFSNLDEFIEFGKMRGGILFGLIEFCGPYTLDIFDRIAGILGLMATMFVITWLYRTNEFTALLAAGISKGRVVRPILIATVGLMVLAVINRELMIPRFASLLVKGPKNLASAKEAKMRPIYDQDRQLTIVGRNMIVDTKTINQPVIRLDGPSAALGKQISATTATYIEANGEHPRGYLLESVQNPKDLGERASIRVQDKVYVMTPFDSPWLKPNQCFVASDIHIDLLEGGSSWKQVSSTYRLISRLRADPRYYGDDIRSTVHQRLLRPLLDMGLVLFGMPIVLRRQERHLFLVAGTSIFLVAGYLGVMIGFQALGDNGSILSPSMAAWTPILLFLPFAWVKSKFAMQS